ncbi:MAG: hypothetical protein KDK45_24845 [Leptospiraceae bacterium]|nr:hypothetical protein [Leptospiraceae bacterium]
MPNSTVQPTVNQGNQKTDESGTQPKRKRNMVQNFFYLNFTRKGRLKKTRDRIKDLARPENNYKMISRLAWFLLIGHTMFFHTWLNQIRPGGFAVPETIPNGKHITTGIEWFIALVMALFVEKMMINAIANRLKIRLFKLSAFGKTWLQFNWSIGNLLALFSIMISIGAYKPFLMKVISTFQETYKPEMGTYQNVSIIFQTFMNIALILGVSVIIPLVIFLYSVKVVRQIKPGPGKKQKKDSLTKEQKQERNKQIFEDLKFHLSQGDWSKLTYEAIAARFIDEHGKPRISSNGVRDLINRTSRNKAGKFDSWQVDIAKAYKAMKEEKNKKAS